MEEEKKTNELKEVTKELIGWEDNKLFRTLSYLTIRPGQINTEYCRGEKHKYLSPIVYFFGAAALETFVATQLGLFDFMMERNKESVRNAFADINLAKTDFDPTYIIDNINRNFSFLFSEIGQKIILVPLLLLLTWLFYRKVNRSFKENSWFALYTLGHVTLLSIPFMLFWYMTKDLTLMSGFSFLLAFAYWVWASKQFYSLKLSKALLLRFLMMVTTQLIIGVGFFVMILIVVASSKR